MNTDLFISEAKTWIDVPFKFKGKTKKGCDCAGLIYGIVSHINKTHVILKCFEEYGNNFSVVEMLIEKHVNKFQAQNTPKYGNVIIFQMEATHFHFGILVKEDKFIHACMTKNRVICTELSRFWREKIKHIISL